MEKLMIFNDKKFGNLKTILIDDEVWFVANEVALLLGYGNGDSKSKAIPNAISDHVDEEDKIMLDYNTCKQIFRGYQNGDSNFKINSNGMRVINESGVYSLALRSKLPQAREFKRWVTKEIIPSIRKNGMYITDDLLEKTISNPDYMIKLLEHLKEEKIKRKMAENSAKHKQKVITGLTKDVTLADKRQRLNSIVRFKGNPYDRWTLLYSEFEKKYHLSVDTRIKNEAKKNKKYKSKVDFIDKNLGMINELYELACKLFETDYENLLKSWCNIINGEEI